MKRNLLIGIIGLASTASVLAQGHIIISHYLAPPYHQLIWDPVIPTVGGTPMNDTNVQIQLWYGEGVIPAQSALQPGEVVSINPAYSYNGGGYYDTINRVLPDWEPGDIYTFQLRASGQTSYGFYYKQTFLWTEQANIVSTSEQPMIATNITIWTIPEPSTLALAGMGLAAIVLIRKRRWAGGDSNEAGSVSDS